MMRLKSHELSQRLHLLKMGRELLLSEFLEPPPEILKNVFIYESDLSVQNIVLECLKYSWLSKWADAASNGENISEHTVSEVVLSFTGFQPLSSQVADIDFFSRQKDGLDMILKASTKSVSKMDAVRVALYKHRAVLNRKLQSLGEPHGNR